MTIAANMKCSKENTTESIHINKQIWKFEKVLKDIVTATNLSSFFQNLQKNVILLMPHKNRESSVQYEKFKYFWESNI